MSDTERTQHIDGKIKIVQGISTSTVIQILLILGGLAGIYARMTAEDATLQSAQVQMRKDIERIDREREVLKGEIRNDLREIRDDLRGLREDLRRQQTGK